MVRPTQRYASTHCLARLAVVCTCLSCATLPTESPPTPLDNLSAANPSPPIVAAVQGDKRHGLEVASIFLTGCKFQCRAPQPSTPCTCRESVFHAPKSISPTPVQLHSQQTSKDFAVFFRDSTFTDGTGQKGRDDDPTDGLEIPRVLFYAGEGHPTTFAADFKSKPIDLKTFSLGDGNVRYLFMMACTLFAHGPRDAKTFDFTAPQQFDPKQLGAITLPQAPGFMTNVFERWGGFYGPISPLNPALRLACGGSSQIGFGIYPTHLFWYYSTLLHLGPADSWLAGLYAPELSSEPLCMSRGDSVRESGLSDPRLAAWPIEAHLPKQVAGKVFAEYPIPIDQADPLALLAAQRAPFEATDAPQPAEPPQLPVLTLRKAAAVPLPAFLQGAKFGDTALPYGFQGGPANIVAPGFSSWLAPPALSEGPTEFHSEDLCVRRQPDSGALIFSWVPVLKGEELSDNEARTLDRTANALLAFLLQALENPAPQASPGPTSSSLDRSTGMQMRVDAAPKDKLENVTHLTDRCLYLRQTMAVHPSSPTPVPVLGEGAENFLAHCPAAATHLVPSSSAATVLSNPCLRDTEPLATFVYNHRVIEGPATQPDGAPTPQRARLAAEALARAQLGEMTDDKSAYQPVATRWGYRAAPPHCSQDKMYLVYDFHYAVKPEAQFSGRAPVTIEIPAHDLGMRTDGSGERKDIEETWKCAPESPD